MDGRAGLLRRRPASSRCGRTAARFQLVKCLYSIGNGGFAGTGLGKGTFTTHRPATRAHPVAQHRLHLLGDRAGARPRRRRRRCCSSSCSSSRAGSASRCSPTTASRSCSPPGLTFGFALQTFIIVGGVLRVIPLTGITLPFVSYGGSSVVANFILLALLLLVSNRANTQASTGRADVNKQITRLALDGRRPDRRARRRDDVLADLGGRRPRRPPGQPDRARRAVHDQARRDLRGRRRAPARDEPSSRRSAAGRSTSASYPTHGLAAHVDRLLDPVALPHRARALDERLPDRLEREPRDGASTDLVDKAEGRDDQGERPRPDADARGRSGSRRRRSGAGAAPSSRSTPQTGKVSSMASSPTYDPNLVEERLRPGDGRARRLQAAGRAAEPRHRRASTRPGSTFKVVTAAAAIDSGRYKHDSTLRRPRLLRGVRQAGQQLRHRRRPVRPRSTCTRRSSTRSTPSSATSARRWARSRSSRT